MVGTAHIQIPVLDFNSYNIITISRNSGVLLYVSVITIIELEEEISIDEREEIAKEVRGEWVQLAHYLQMSPHMIDNIKDKARHKDDIVKAHYCLYDWMNSLSMRADTRNKLAAALRKLGKEKLALKVENQPKKFKEDT